MAATSTFGVLGEYNPDEEEWHSYIERLELYCEANGVTTEEQKRAVLLSCCGQKVYTLIRGLVSPAKPKDKTYNELKEIAGKHFQPPSSSIMHRLKFNSRIREKGESIASYIAALRQLAEFCEFEDKLNDMLRDRLVCGVNDERIQRRLLSEANLTFENAMKLAQASESADKDTRRLKGQGDSHASAVHYQTTKKKAATSSTFQIVCIRCGGNHLAPDCRFQHIICKACGKKGHFARMCRSKGRKKPSKAEPPRPGQSSGSSHSKQNYVDEQKEEATPNKEKGVPPEELSEIEKDNSYEMYSLSNRSSAPIIVEIELNGRTTEMIVDTGAAKSIINEKTYENLEKGRELLRLRESSALLTTYTGESLELQGQVEVPVKYKSQSLRLPILVTEGTGPNLLGRDWLSSLKLDWKGIFQVRESTTLDGLLTKYSGVFSEGLGKLKGTSVKIQVKKNARARFYKARTVPYVYKDKVEEELEQLQKDGVISPVQFSDWAAPIVPVVKSNGSIRICGDYKLTVNQELLPDIYPLPRVEDLFADLSGGETFSKLDLSKAYLQLPVDEDSKKYLTVNTHKGLFVYNRVPFGITSAPGVFQRTMESLFKGFKHVSVYIDDILVTGRTREEHMKNLERVLAKLEEVGLKLNRDKCKFMMPKVEYLGYIIDKHGLHPTEAKIQAIRQAKTPTNLTELRAFLGMINYYSKFLQDLSTKLAPLYALLHKETKWRWGEKEEKTFGTAKELLQSDAVLVHFDPSRRLVLACDASPYGIGAVLSHVMDDNSEKPIAYASRTLTAAEQKYSQLDKEALAILFGVTKFHSYVYGRRFVIQSDHRPLYHLFNETRGIPTLASARLQRWALTLSAYQYQIMYKPGKDLSNADALSRLPKPVTTDSDCLPGELIQLLDHMSTMPVTAQDVRKGTDRDPVLSQVREYVMSSWPSTQLSAEFQPYTSRKYELSVQDGCLLWGSRMVIPPQERKLLLQELHDTHLGVSKMKGLARGYFWWPNLSADIEDHVKHCESWQLSRPQPTTAPVHPWEWPKDPWDRIHLDFAGPWMNSMFLVLVDAGSKWLDVRIMKSITSAATIEVLQQIFSSHGLPKSIVTDNGPSFVSDEFNRFCRVNGIRHITSSPYHPSTNGLAERGVQSFKQGVKRMEGGNLQSKLSRFLFRYRITPHSTTGISPAEMLFGRRLRSQLDLIRPDVAGKVEKKQASMVSQGAGKVVRAFQVGETVYARDYRQNQDKWVLGEIVKVSGPLSYHVKTADGTVRRHVDGIRKRYTDTEVGQPENSTEEMDDFPIPVNLEPDPGNPGDPVPNPAPAVTAGTTTPRPDRPAQVVDAATAATPARNCDGTVTSRHSARNRPPPDYYHNETWN